MKNLILSFIFLCITATHAQEIDLDNFASGFTHPLNIQNAGDDRLFVLEQEGIIKIVSTNDGVTNSEPFLDISDLTVSAGERGLLGLAFHPEYQTNGIFFIYYTDLAGDTTVAKYEVSTDNPDIADPDSATIILTVDQPFGNHNGGSIVFGPDNYLYIGLGDGGSGGDPNINGQNKNSLLGTILRLDVDNGSPYSIPSDNPFADDASAKAEIWAYGLRNPWKFSFDPETGDLWIADVGQGNIEEIDKVAYTEAGLNYGWRCYEGTATYNTTDCPEASTLTFPVTEYQHDIIDTDTGIRRCSVTGGFVYRGSAYPDLVGKYVFADYCTNEIGTVTADGSDSYAIKFSKPYPGNAFSSFGVDNNGELYVAGYESGNILKVVTNDLGVGDNTAAAIRFYPNPAKSVLKISGSGNDMIELTIFNIEGKIVLTAATNREKEIDISSLKSGVYLIKSAKNGKNLGVQKLIIE